MVSSEAVVRSLRLRWVRPALMRNNASCAPMTSIAAECRFLGLLRGCMAFHSPYFDAGDRMRTRTHQEYGPPGAAA
ncbi:hypothetical protein Scani_64750 [Streptomyces caniferus]|uniref:Uncharacterized protein n=1 Tax=Streptomyces caniferus TaxID=285557 RepID=A0A640SG48_9ACTN|nr:hypothetical protein Scani_64750 [Streptomyces caniferus]